MPKLKKFRVHFISVLKTEDPANQKSVIYKSDDGSSFRFEFNLKHLRKDAKQGVIHGTVYEPDVQDTQHDWADAEQIQEAAHAFMMEKRVNMVDVDHSYEPGSGTVVESSIKNGPDSRYPNTKDGSWVVTIKLSDEAMKNLDEVKGLSMAGGGIYDNAAPPPKSATRKGGFKQKAETDAQGDQTPEQLIQNLKDAGQWPANYDDDSDGATMSDIFAAIQANCDDKGIVVGSIPVLDALASKLMNAPPDQDPDDPNAQQKSVTRIRPLKGTMGGTRFRINSHT